MIHPLILWRFSIPVKPQRWRARAEMYGWSEMKEKVFAVQPARMIYPFHQLHHLKRTSLPRIFFWGKHQLPTADEGERKRVRRGRKSVPASRCFNLFTSCQWKWWPAEGFFSFFFFLSLGTEYALAKHIAGGTLWTSVIFIVWWIPQRRLIGRDPALTLISLIKVLRLCWICDQWRMRQVQICHLNVELKCQFGY